MGLEFLCFCVLRLDLGGPAVAWTSRRRQRHDGDATIRMSLRKLHLLTQKPAPRKRLAGLFGGSQ